MLQSGHPDGILKCVLLKAICIGGVIKISWGLVPMGQVIFSVSYYQYLVPMGHMNLFNNRIPINNCYGLIHYGTIEFLF